MAEEVVLVKISGSVITDPETPNTARQHEIHRIVQEIKESKFAGRLIIGHGSGAFGHVPGHRYQVHKGLINEESRKGASITQNVAANLHRMVVGAMCDHELNPLSFPPSAGAIAVDRKIMHWDLSPLKLAMENGFVPVTLGDVVVDRKLGVTIVSTEEAFRFIASELKPRRIIIGGDTDGVFTSDPKAFPDAELISTIDSGNIGTAIAGAGGSRKVDVTGGMRSKLEFLYEMARNTGAVCQIVNIAVHGRMRSAISGEEVIGTLIKG